MTAKKTAKKSGRTPRKTAPVAPKRAAESTRKKVALQRSTDDTISGPPTAFPPGMSNPATRALRSIGVTRVSELIAHREADVAALHGMGPSGVKALKTALKAQGKSFRA